MISNIRIRNDTEAIKQIVRCDYTEIVKVVVRADGSNGYVLHSWLQLPERRRLEKAGFIVARTASGGTFIHE